MATMNNNMVEERTTHPEYTGGGDVVAHHVVIDLSSRCMSSNTPSVVVVTPMNSPSSSLARTPIPRSATMPPTLQAMDCLSPKVVVGTTLSERA